MKAYQLIQERLLPIHQQGRSDIKLPKQIQNKKNDKEYLTKKLVISKPAVKCNS